jgi:hypothetical protein
MLYGTGISSGIPCIFPPRNSAEFRTQIRGIPQMCKAIRKNSDFRGIQKSTSVEFQEILQKFWNLQYIIINSSNSRDIVSYEWAQTSLRENLNAEGHGGGVEGNPLKKQFHDDSTVSNQSILSGA